MTVHFFTKGDRKAGSARQRAFYVAEELEKRGIKTKIYPPPIILSSRLPWRKKMKLLGGYLKNFLAIKKEDVVFLQRTIYNKYFFLLVVAHKIIFRRKMVFDIDDAVYMHSSLKVKTFARLADVMIVGSHSLADWAKKYNKNIYIIPTCVHSSHYQKFSHDYTKERKEIVIGWVGGAKDQYEYLKMFSRPLAKVAAKFPGKIKFTLIGALKYQPIYDLFNNIPHLKAELIDELDWSNPDAVPSHIQDFDIGVMPLFDTEWERGKCSFKAIEYMACGVATVASAVGENNYLIKDGVDGFLAKDEKEWEEKLTKLAEDKELCARLGKKGQETIKQRYSYQANMPKMAKILKEEIWKK